MTRETNKACEICGSVTCPAASGWAWRCPEAPIEVLTERLPEFRKAFVRLVRKAAKLGVPAPRYDVLGPYTKVTPRLDEQGMVRIPVRFRRVSEITPVKVHGTAPQFKGWSLLAVLEPVDLPDGTFTNIVRGVPGAGEIPTRYRDRGPTCDHCRTTRRRSETFLVRHEDGRIVQVGRSCVADFLGGVSPDQLAGLFTYFLDGGDGEDEGWSSGSRLPDALPLVDFLGLVVRETRANGWLSRKAASETGGISTAERAWKRAFPSEGRAEAADEEELALARSAVAWVLSLTPKSDYEHNILVRARLGFTEFRAAGLSAAIWPSYERACAREVERRQRAAVSTFQGAEGESIERFVTVTRVIDLTGDYGVSYLHLMRDEQGNAYKWFSSSARLDAGSFYRLVGKVKRHESWKPEGSDVEVKTTILTRCEAYDPYVARVKLGKTAIKAAGGEDALAALGVRRAVKYIDSRWCEVPTTEESVTWDGKLTWPKGEVSEAVYEKDTYEGSYEAAMALVERLKAAGKAGVKAADAVLDAATRTKVRDTVAAAE